MTRIGTVEAVYRYPVKTMLGESPDRIEVDASGVVGDRRWGVRNERRGDFSTGKRVARLMDCAARLPEDGGAPEITLPDGARLRVDDPDAGRRLSEALGEDVTLWPASAPPAPAAPPEPPVDPEADFRAVMGRTADEPMPDFSQLPDALMAKLAEPERPFVDLSPLMVMTRQSLDAIAKALPDVPVDVRRFRPSLLVAASGDAAQNRFPEQAWIGHRIRLGDAVVSIQATCPRCVMTTHGFAELPKAPGVMRSLVAEAEGNLGVYATVERPGAIAVGDVVERLD